MFVKRGVHDIRMWRTLHFSFMISITDSPLLTFIHKCIHLTHPKMRVYKVF